MAGFTIVTNSPPRETVQIARQTAKELGFSVARIHECSFSACRGNLPLSIFLGAFIAYCDFEVLVRESPDGRTEVIIQRNMPWWTGAIGVGRVKKAAGKFAKGIADSLEREGAKIYEEKEFP